VKDLDKETIKLFIRYSIAFFLSVSYNNLGRFLLNKNEIGTAFGSMFFIIEFSLVLGALILTLGNSRTHRRIGLKLTIGGILVFIALSMGGLIDGETLLGHFSFKYSSIIGTIIIYLEAYMNIIGILLVIDAIFDFIFKNTEIKKIRRKKEGSLLFGVFSGIGHSFGINPKTIRIIFVLLLLFSSSYLSVTLFYISFSILLYIVLIIILPKED
jgi:phage shock protein PspC (stress-responsive transcriptional regulator)